MKERIIDASIESLRQEGLRFSVVTLSELSLRIIVNASFEKLSHEKQSPNAAIDWLVKLL